MFNGLEIPEGMKLDEAPPDPPPKEKSERAKVQESAVPKYLQSNPWKQKELIDDFVTEGKPQEFSR